MTFFKSLFKNKNKTIDNSKDLSEHLEFIESLKRPAISLIQNDSKSFSKLGGLPYLPQGLDWPENNGTPLEFICQIDLSEIPTEFSQYKLPESGQLFVFYDQSSGSWGFDPQDKGDWKIVYSSLPPKHNETPLSEKWNKDKIIFNEKFITLVQIDTYPDWQDDRIRSLQLTDKQAEEYDEIIHSVYKGQEQHQLFGFPSLVQDNEMAWECELVTNGIYCGDAKGYQTETAQKLKENISDWVMLLQIDSDDSTDMMWGDCGMLYFWIKREDLKANRFENTWMIFQCC